MFILHGCRLSALLLALPFATSVWTDPPKAEDNRASHTDAYGDPLPLGALARLGTVRMHTGNQVECVAFSADGKVFATGEEWGTIRFWDLKTD
jgi:WD40 repeat protein